MTMRKGFKAGDKIVFGRGKKNRGLCDITIGKIYTLLGSEGQDPYFYADNGRHDSAGIDDGFNGKATLVVR